MTSVLLIAMVATGLYAVGARRAARICAVRCALWIPALAIGPAVCAALSTRHVGIVAATLAICAACVSAQTDLQCGLIFDAVSLVALGLLLLRGVSTGTFTAACVGAAALALLLGSLWALSGGRGIGLGDVKFAGVIGSAFGCAWGVAALGAAFVGGGIAAGVLLSCGRVHRQSGLPLAPFLALGCVFAAAMGGSLS